MAFTSIKVTRLPPTITKEKLAEHFREAGELKGDPFIKYSADNKPTHAFINFYNTESAEKALNLKSDGMKVTPQIKSVPSNTAKEQKVVESKDDHSTHGFPESKPCPHSGSPTTGSSPLTSSSVKVTHLPSTITSKKLVEHFKSAGELRDDPFIKYSADNKPIYAYINFHDPKAAESAVEHLNLSTIDEMSITVKLQTKAKEQKDMDEDCNNSTHTTPFLTQPHPPIPLVPSTTPTSPPEAPQPPDSVKVTHLPPTITKEKLAEHFKMAGELKGVPVICHCDKKPAYAYINFLDPKHAIFAVEQLNGTSIDGVSLTVKIKKTYPQKEEPKEKRRDDGCYMLVMKLDESQWKSMMLPAEGNLFKEVMAPYRTNPNVVAMPVDKEQCVEFKGQREAVEDAYSSLRNNLSWELTIDSKPKREALAYLKPSLPDDLLSEYDVTITGFAPCEATIKFKGASGNSKEKAHEEVKKLVDSLHLKEVSIPGGYSPERLERVRADIRQHGAYACESESQPWKAVVLCSFDPSQVDQLALRVQQLLNVMPFECKPEEAVYLWHFHHKQGSFKNLPAKVEFVGKDHTEVTIAGGDSEILASKTRLQEILAGLLSRKFVFSCNSKFQKRIENIVTSFESEKSFKCFIPKSSSHSHRRGSQAKGEEGNSSKDREIVVYIFSEDEGSRIFTKVSQLLQRFKPTSKHFHFSYKDVDAIIREMKPQLESKYTYVEITTTKSRPGSMVIHGLDPDEIQKSYDAIKEKIDSTLVVTKYEPVNLQLYTLLRPELDKLRQFCQEMTVLPPNKDHEGSCMIRIKGSISQVKDVKERLSGLLSINVTSETFDLSCPKGLFGMWCRRWNQVKEQEAKRLKVNVEFRKTADSADSQKLNIHFKVVGTDSAAVQEVQAAIISEGVETEEKTFSLSSNGCTCLLKAKREKNFEFLNELVVHMGNIDKQANKVTLCAPKELSDELEMAEEHIRNFVGDRASTSHVLRSKNPVVGLVLSNPAHAQPFMMQANALAKDHKASVTVLKKPSVGLRISGTEAAVGSIKHLIKAAVIDAIEMIIGEKCLSVKGLYGSFLSSLDFSRFQFQLEKELSVTCTYPKASRLVASSMVALGGSEGQYLRVDICKGSVVHEEVDAIVNASNENLKHTGGLAKTISDAGGPSIQAESDEYVRTRGKVRPGGAVCLGAGSLPCKKVIHVVGLRWNGGQQGEEQVLYSAIFESLRATDRESLTSIAFPAIGTGIFAVPLEICARASLKAVRDFCKAHPNTGVQNVKFVLFQEEAVSAFQPMLKSGICGEYQHDTTTSSSTRHSSARPLGVATGGGAIPASSQSSQWLWYNDQGSFTTYSATDAACIENMYLTKKPGQLTISGRSYTFDFKQMCQINLNTNYQRPIKRQLSEQQSTFTPLLMDVAEEDEPVKDIVLTLRGPQDSLEAAEKRVQSKLDNVWKKQKMNTLPKNMPGDLEKKIKQIAKRNEVMCTFDEKAKKQKVLVVEGVFFKVSAAVSAIQEEILTFHVTSSQSEEELTFPPEWQPQQGTVQLFTVPQGSAEWQHVEGKFAYTMGSGHVHSISRIQNEWVWERYVTQKKRLDRKNNGRVNEMELFHGTRGNDPKVIYDGEDGFDMRFSRAGMWGMANYFAVNAKYSHNYAFTSTNGRQMFLVKVLTGDSHNCQPDSSLRMPPIKSSGAQGGDVQFSQMRHDTVTGHTGGSQVYMTYDNDKAYPAYLITYN